MKSSRADHREHWLLLKSIGCVTLTTAAFWLLLRHVSPVEEKDKFFGGRVSLLLARTPDDVKEFRRWMELNDPSRIFGYSSAGIFSRTVTREGKVELPSVRFYTPESMKTVLYLPVAPKIMPLEMEKTAETPAVIRESPFAGNVSLSLKGVPVFDEKGEIVTTLENIPGTNGEKALLLRAGNSAAGVDFSIIESSGDRNFDRSVTLALERFAQKGKNFAGVLAVWPDPKEKAEK